MDWARLHAAVNDLPAALLLVSVLFDLMGAINKRESLKAAGFWTLMAGVAGTTLAFFAGKLAEGTVEHQGAAHGVMETHETLGTIVLVLFGALAVWRLVRRGVLSEKEVPVALTAGVIGVALMIFTARLGATLVWDHGVGIDNATIETIRAERASEAAPHEHEPGEEHNDAPDSGGVNLDSLRADSAKRAHDSIPHAHPADSAPR